MSDLRTPRPEKDNADGPRRRKDRPRRRKQVSSLRDLSLLGLERADDDDKVALLVDDNPDENPILPIDTFLLVTETEKLHEEKEGDESTVINDLVADISDFDFTLEEGKFKVRDWDGKKGYSDYIADGLKYKQMENKNVVMLFESPSSSTADFSFQNKTKFRFHDWPPPSKTGGKSVLGPCRYALMNGTSFPVFLKDEAPPKGLVEHWTASVPGFKPPHYVSKITDDETVYAYLPVEQIRHHVNDPDSK